MAPKTSMTCKQSLRLNLTPLYEMLGRKDGEGWAATDTVQLQKNQAVPLHLRYGYCTQDEAQVDDPSAGYGRNIIGFTDIL